MKRRAWAIIGVVGLSLLVTVALVGCTPGTTTGGGSATPPADSSGGTAGASGTTITEKDFTFSPADATVRSGDTVTFTNDDSAPHNVKIDGKELGIQQPGESKTWTAPKDGSYPFSCAIHPSMAGKITVGAGDDGTQAPTDGTGGGSEPPPGTGGYY